MYSRHYYNLYCQSNTLLGNHNLLFWEHSRFKIIRYRVCYWNLVHIILTPEPTSFPMCIVAPSSHQLKFLKHLKHKNLFLDINISVDAIIYASTKTMSFESRWKRLKGEREIFFLCLYSIQTCEKNNRPFLLSYDSS